MNISNSYGEELTEKQWAKKFIAQIALKHEREIHELVKEFEPDEQEVIYRQFHDLLRVMTTRRGFADLSL